MTTALQFERIKNNTDKYNKELERTSNYIKNRYKTDPEFRERLKKNALARKQRLKDEKEALERLNSSITQ